MARIEQHIEFTARVNRRDAQRGGASLSEPVVAYGLRYPGMWNSVPSRRQQLRSERFDQRIAHVNGVHDEWIAWQEVTDVYSQLKNRE